jgi:hypothetical protein
MSTGDVDELLTALSRPIFVRNMARGMFDSTRGLDEKDPRRRSVDTRIEKTRREIHDAVMAYAAKHGAPGVGLLLTGDDVKEAAK